MIEAGIDQVTIVLLAHDDVLNNKNHRWRDIASEIILEVEESLNLIDILGEKSLMKKAISGYSIGYTYGNHDFSFAIYYHHQYARMGVLVKFSAQALAYYQGQTNLYVYEVLQKMQSQIYEVRCSRIDIALDFINEGINITEIQNQYNNKELKIMVMRERNRKIEQIAKSHSIHGITEGSEFQTIYLGKRDSPLYMRIYDKKHEQISNQRSRRSEVNEYND
ncbi:replication initiation factor domain-containing protein [Ruminococcus sp. JL13D9]|uniref:replication initiation factor domain-containing protein n=1 Tax=Ruminococcus sp. JL13D9 TaxID=3233381 RepID=UPI00389A815D